MSRTKRTLLFLFLSQVVMVVEFSPTLMPTAHVFLRWRPLARLLNNTSAMLQIGFAFTGKQSRPGVNYRSSEVTGQDMIHSVIQKVSLTIVTSQGNPYIDALSICVKQYMALICSLYGRCVVEHECHLNRPDMTRNMTSASTFAQNWEKYRNLHFCR